jgi:hypothetical protein
MVVVDGFAHLRLTGPAISSCCGCGQSQAAKENPPGGRKGDVFATQAVVSPSNADATTSEKHRLLGCWG